MARGVTRVRGEEGRQLKHFLLSLYSIIQPLFPTDYNASNCLTSWLAQFSRLSLLQ